MEINLFLIILAIIFATFIVIGSSFEYIVFFQILRCRTKNANNLTGQQTAEMLLEKVGLADVQVKKCGWFSGFFYSNYYNPKKKTIYLKGRIYDKASIASVGIATQKVALAIQDKNGDKCFKTKSKFQPYILLAPILFIPISLLGIVLDLSLSQTLGYISVALIGIALLLLIVSFIFLLMSLPAEKKANTMAIEIIEQTNLLDGTELAKVKKLYKIDILLYIGTYIMTTLYMIGLFFKILGKLLNKK